jgi:hypothetical protein
MRIRNSPFTNEQDGNSQQRHGVVYVAKNLWEAQPRVQHPSITTIPLAKEHSDKANFHLGAKRPRFGIPCNYCTIRRELLEADIIPECSNFHVFVSRDS